MLQHHPRIEVSWQFSVVKPFDVRQTLKSTLQAYKALDSSGIAERELTEDIIDLLICRFSNSCEISYLKDELKMYECGDEVYSVMKTLYSS